MKNCLWKGNFVYHGSEKFREVDLRLVDRNRRGVRNSNTESMGKTFKTYMNKRERRNDPLPKPSVQRILLHPP